MLGESPAFVRTTNRTQKNVLANKIYPQTGLLLKSKAPRVDAYFRT